MYNDTKKVHIIIQTKINEIYKHDCFHTKYSISAFIKIIYKMYR
jgi:hypothetical protein